MEQAQNILVGREAEIKHLDAIVSSMEAEFVDECRGVWLFGVEVEESLELFLDAGDVVVEGLLVEKVALCAFHGWVSDHAGRSAYECDGLVSGCLEVFEQHDADEVSDVE